MKSYSEKLKDPRWQKKRLEVMERAGFACESCGNKTETLHIHHGYYERKLNPWDYDAYTLHCLCGTCHQSVQEALEEIHKLIAGVDPVTITNRDLVQIANAAIAGDRYEPPGIEPESKPLTAVEFEAGKAFFAALRKQIG
jgi:hypothetical protein